LPGKCQPPPGIWALSHRGLSGRQNERRRQGSPHVCRPPHSLSTRSRKERIRGSEQARERGGTSKTATVARTIRAKSANEKKHRTGSVRKKTKAQENTNKKCMHGRKKMGDRQRKKTAKLNKKNQKKKIRLWTKHLKPPIAGGGEKRGRWQCRHQVTSSPLTLMSQVTRRSAIRNSAGSIRENRGGASMDGLGAKGRYPDAWREVTPHGRDNRKPNVVTGH